ncbi:MAG: hypothetical protein IJX39_07015, partial [Clostridia bacterium]|nr:hypothetical protein [Clostridia bacterium]
MSNEILIRCKVCGSTELIEQGGQRKCRYCGAVYQIASPRMENDLQTANAFRECTRFEEAEALYKQMLKSYRDQDLSEVYWNLLLCEQRVMFETDEKGERFPSFYAITDGDAEDSPYYISAVSTAEKYAPERAAIFKDLTAKMQRAKQLYARIEQTSRPYDLFICFKKSKTDGSGDTKDCA